MRKLSLLACFALLLLPVQAQKEPSIPLITVSGQAEIMVAPDEVVFNLRVVTVNKDVVQAQAINDEAVKKVLAVARKYQIPPEQTQTSYVSLGEKYSEYDGRAARTFLGYKADKTIAVTLRDLSKTEALLVEFLQSGANRIDSLDFRNTKITEYRAQARVQAVRVALTKASAMAQSVGQSIGKAHSIQEENIAVASRYSNINSNSNVAVLSDGGNSSADSESSIAPGRIAVRARVTVSFELNRN